MGVVNGVSASFSSGARAVGPTVAGWLFNLGEERGTSVLVWWIVAAVAVVGGVESLCMRVKGEEDGREEVAGMGGDDGDVFSEDEERYDGGHGSTRKTATMETEKEKDVSWIQGEQEGQAEAGFGAPRALGPSVVSLVSAIVRDDVGKVA